MFCTSNDALLLHLCVAVVIFKTLAFMYLLLFLLRFKAMMRCCDWCFFLLFVVVIVFTILVVCIIFVISFY